MGSTDISGSVPIDKEIMILRQRFIIDYSSQGNKRIREEYTIKCITNIEEGIDNIFIKSPKLLQNLKIFDSDGTQLALVTNKFTRALLTNRLKKSKDDSEKKTIEQLIDDTKNHRIFLLWIKLPHYRKFFTNESRVIILEYEPTKEDTTEKTRVMEFHSAPYETFYAVTPPDDFEFNTKEVITIDPKTKKEIKKETSWESKKSGDPYYFTESQNSIFARINPNAPNQYLFNYSFKPKKTITALPWFALGLLIAGSFIILFSNNSYFLEYCGTIQLCWVTTPVEGTEINFAIAIIAASLVVPRLIRNVEIRDSLKFWYIFPIIISIIGLYV